MSEEIKEILDKMKDYSGECHSILAYSLCGYKKKIRNDFRMCMNDVDKLLDYITNLQQENKQLKVKSEVLEGSNKLLIQQKAQMYEDLDIAYERIDKAREYIKDGEVEYDDNDDETKEKIYSIYVPTLLEILGDKENEN